MRPSGFLGRFPVTVTVAVGTLAISVPALFSPGLVRLLEQRPGDLWDGQWWRLVTPMVIQGYGLGQLLFNLAGIVWVGAAVEKRYPRWQWPAIYFGTGITEITVSSLWFPARVDSGSSAAVAGLIAALVVHLLRSRQVPAWPSLLYAVLFVVYLCTLAYSGPVAAAVAGTLTVSVFALWLWSMTHAALLRAVVAALVAVSACLLLIIGDPHGTGLTAGLLITVLTGFRRRSGRPRATAS